MQWLIMNLNRFIAKKKKEIIIDSISDCDGIQKTLHEICELQIKDNDLLPYFQYWRKGSYQRTSEMPTALCSRVRRWT